MIRKYTNIILILLVLITPLKVLGATKDEMEEAVLQSALAFSWKEEKVQYDSFRQDATAKAEDASSNHTIYTDCSVFLYQVYLDALNIEIPRSSYDLANYANNIKSDNVIFNLNALSATNNSNILKEMEKWLNGNTPFGWNTGDILVVRRFDGSGHVMMINNTGSEVKIIESGYTSGGGYYDSATHTDKTESGSIGTDSLKNKLKTAINYGNTSPNSIKQLSVIRVINDKNIWVNANNKKISYNLSSTALSRLEYPNLSIEKIAKVDSDKAKLGLDYALPNSTITYEIKITNYSNKDYHDMTLEEEKSSLVEFLDKSNGNVKGNKITFNINSLKAKTYTTIKYSVKVPNDINLFGQVITSTGYLENIKLATLKHYIYNALDNNNVNKLMNSYMKLRNSNSYDLEFISKMYKDAFNYDLSFLENISFDKIINIKNCSSTGYCLPKISNRNVKNITLNNYYGIRIVPFTYQNRSGYNFISQNLINENNAWDVFKTDEESRAREITINDLQKGDIIIYKDTTTKGYIYLDDGLVRKSPQGITILSGNELVNFLRNIVGDNYLILRPALLMNKTISSTVSENKTGSNTNTKTIDLTSDGSEVTVEEIENPDCGYAVPIIFVMTLIGLYIIVKLRLKPSRLYRLN